MKVKKILIASDCPFLTTGYGNLSRRLGEYISKADGIEVAYFGFSDPRSGNQNEFNGITINNRVFKNQNNFAIVEKNFRPDVIIMLMDIWRTMTFMKSKAVKVFIAHIEGEPLPTIINLGREKINVVSMLSKMDFIIPAGPFGYRVIEDRFNHIMTKADIKKKMPTIIPDCLDINIFKPLNDNYKKKMFNLSDDMFLVGWFGRMSARKGLPYAIEAFSKAKIENKMMYIHTPMDDPYGWNLMQLLKDYGVENKSIVNNNLTLSRGDSEDTMVKLYNACDITLQPSAGEGFGLTIAESMACGNPVIINKYSELERFADATVAIEPKTFFIEPKTNIKRAIANTDSLAASIEMLSTNKKYHKYVSDRARAATHEFSMEKVGNQWINFINNITEGSEIIIEPEPIDVNVPLKDIIIPRVKTTVKSSSKKPKILGICNHFYPIVIGGGEKVTANMVAGLCDTYDFKIVVHNVGQPENAYRVKDDNYDLGDTEIIYLNKQFDKKIDMIIEDFKPDHILVLSFSQPDCIKYLLNNYADKLIIYSQLSPIFKVFSDIGFENLKKCPKIISNSDYVKNEFKKFNITTDRIYPLININKTIGAHNTNKTHILSINPQVGKGYNVIKQLIHDIPERNFIVAGCTMAGVDKNKIINDMPEWINFYLEDYVEDMKPLYERSKVVLNPSTAPESFGLVNAEAILNKSIIISTDIGALRESGGPRGIYIQPGADINEWVGAINNACDINNSEIIDENYKYAIDTFSEEKIIGQWRDVLNYE